MNKKVVISNIFIIILMLCTTVYAAINANLNLKINTTSIKAGDEFIVTLSLKDLTGITSGVDSIQGYINIDENVLESITFDSIVKDSDNKIKIGNESVKVYDVNELDDLQEYGVFFNNQLSENDCKIVIDLKNKVTTQDLISFKFKVKSGVKEADYSDVIKYEMFSITEGITGQSPDLSGTVSIKVVKNSTVTNKNNVVVANKVNTTNKVNNVVNKANTTNKNNTTNKASNTNKNNTTNKSNTANKANIIDKTNNTNKINNKNTKVNKVTNEKNTVIIRNSTDNTVANQKIPAAGITSTIIRILVAISIVGFIIYVKYKKYKQI